VQHSSRPDAATTNQLPPMLRRKDLAVALAHSSGERGRDRAGATIPGSDPPCRANAHRGRRRYCHRRPGRSCLAPPPEQRRTGALSGYPRPSLERRIRGGYPTLYGLLERARSRAVGSYRAPAHLPSRRLATIGAGARALVPRETSAGCPPIEVTVGPDQGAAVLPNYAAIAPANEPYSYDPVLGLLASQLRSGGGARPRSGRVPRSRSPMRTGGSSPTSPT
jgi:hypothetical protein